MAAATTTSRLHDALRTDILAGRLPAGRRLNLEELRAHYGVSLSPLREALNRLLNTGLVVNLEQRGFWVAELSVPDLEDLARTRFHIERAALVEAIAKGDDDWEAQIHAALHKLRKASIAPADAVVISADREARHRAFHQALISACGSRRLLAFWDEVYDQGVRYRRLAESMALPHGNGVAAHQELAELAVRRDVEGAVAALQGHVGVSARLLASLVAARTDDAATGLAPTERQSA